MALVYKIQEFLEKKFSELKLTRKDFVEQSGIPYSTVTHIIKGLIINPTINHIFKIASYFNCSLDEVIGRTQYVSPVHRNFRTISSNDISDNLKKYVEDKAKSQNINLYTLGRDIGFSNNSLRGFIKGTREQKTFNSQIIIALADYFQISLDEMVGRIKPATSDNDKLSSLREGEADEAIHNE
ncbi:helix-turn-helix domain-containing protein [Candidatus Tisiphia endosymbiont of Hybos culiciformis]|uniref:helix-turn-helix domain-containing protein n=1 Tax=Candidatus Tisiphia endosymbiont of Hybos culiciformis TaxID=3139331 RepID=UPI003CCB6C26